MAAPRPARVFCLVWTLVLVPVPARAAQGREAIELKQIEEMQRQEGEAILALADAALAGRTVPSDFEVGWQNEFLKAQRGTFVPFTLTVDATRLTRPSALVYVRVVPRAAVPRGDERRSTRPLPSEFPVDAIFAVELEPDVRKRARVSRGFSVRAGEYDLYVVLRERADPAVPRWQPKAAVLKRPLSVPNFWSGELSASSVIVADRLIPLSRPVTPEELVDRPYALGHNEIVPAGDRKFRRDEELIFVFLVYDPAVTDDGTFDLQVEYHFYRTVGPEDEPDARRPAAAHPPAREGERYFNYTDPQRFNPAVLGSQFDPAAGHPVMAGQGVPLAGFPEGDYRLAISVTDLVSGKSIMRDVHFTVGS